VRTCEVSRDVKRVSRELGRVEVLRVAVLYLGTVFINSSSSSRFTTSPLRRSVCRGIWGRVRHPLFFWLVWQHVPGGPLHASSPVSAVPARPRRIDLGNVTLRCHSHPPCVCPGGGRPVPPTVHAFPIVQTSKQVWAPTMTSEGKREQGRRKQARRKTFAFVRLIRTCVVLFY
jgi:hypothetical protein